MARFAPTIDIQALSPEERSKLQPGQWVKAGDQQDAPRGRFWGERSASTVVAWSGNARGRGWGYHQALRAYAKGDVRA